MQVGEIAAKFSFNLILARFTGPLGTGIFYSAFSITVFGAVLGRVGQDRSLLRYVSSLIAQGRSGAARSAVKRGLLLTIGCSAATALVVVMSSKEIARYLGQEADLADVVRVLGVAIVPLALLTVVASLLRALRRIWSSQLVLSVLWPTLTCLGLLLVGASASHQQVAWIQLSSLAVTATVGFIWLAHAFNRHVGPAERFPVQLLLSSGREMCVITLFNTALQWLPILILGLFATSAEVGVFAMASRIAVLAAFAVTAVNWIVAPLVASAHGTGNTAAVERTAQRATVLCMAFGLPIVAAFFIVPQYVMGLFGEAFVDGGTTLQILALGYAASIVAGPVGIVLTMTGHERALRSNVTTAFVVTLVAGLALIPSLGSMGAAVAVTLGMMVQNLLGALCVWNTLRIRTIPISLGLLR